MQSIQEILEPVVPSWAGMWQAGDDSEQPPAQFLVYSVSTQDYFADDVALYSQDTATMTLWSMSDPTAMAAKVRAALRGAGWELIEEQTVGNAYDTATHRYCVNSRWLGPLRSAD